MRRRGQYSSRSRARRKGYLPDETLSLGCAGCSLRGPCGGLRDQSRRFSCLDDCCGGSADCDDVCPRNLSFSDRVREIGGFDFRPLTAENPSRPDALPLTMPMIYHGYRRISPARLSHVAVPLFRLLSRRDCIPIHRTDKDVCEDLLIAPEARLFLSGVERDAPLERLWSIGRARRREVFERLRDLNVCGVSTPNFTTFRDRPRPDALHSLSRINLVFDEMQVAGLPAVLHINCMVERDYERLAEWIAREAGVSHVAAEFGTGLKVGTRASLHTIWLIELARRVPRPLHLVLRGGFQNAAALATAFSGITLIETDSFSKTRNRQEAFLTTNAGLGWRSTPLAPNTPLDSLLATNIFLRASTLRDLLAAGSRAA